MPLSIIEAMACGLPIVAVSEKGLKEMVIDRGNGFHTMADQPVMMSEKVMKILNDQNLRQHFSITSRKLAYEYSEERISALLVTEYEKVINNKSLKR
jgi:glycosyltransferase EpsD